MFLFFHWHSGGIPYGSVTGMVARYANRDVESSNQYYLGNVVQTQPAPSFSPSRVVVTPNVRAAGVLSRQQGPVQIYNLPGVVAPGIVGRYSQIGYWYLQIAVNHYAEKKIT